MYDVNDVIITVMRGAILRGWRDENVLWRQSFHQHKCSRIVFMYGDIHGSFPIGSWTDFVTELTMSYYRKELSAACRKSYEFGFYRR